MSPAISALSTKTHLEVGTRSSSVLYLCLMHVSIFSDLSCQAPAGFGGGVVASLLAAMHARCWAMIAAADSALVCVAAACPVLRTLPMLLDV